MKKAKQLAQKNDAISLLKISQLNGADLTGMSGTKLLIVNTNKVPLGQQVTAIVFLSPSHPSFQGFHRILLVCPF